VISRIEALGYRALRYVSQAVGPFQILVGPNASGKSTFLDAMAFLGDMLRAGPARAIIGDRRAGIAQRAPDPRHLFWMRRGSTFQIAVELAIPPERLGLLKNGDYSTARYETAIGFRGDVEQVGVVAETLWLRPDARQIHETPQRTLFPSPVSPPDSIVASAGRKAPPGWKRIVNKVEESGNDYFQSETSGWRNPFRLGPGKAALANLPEDEALFPVATWVKRVLLDGVQRIALNSEAMRRPSPPGETSGFLPDGSNLPWVVHTLESRVHRQRLAAWIEHLRIALPDLVGITTKERPEDRHRYLVLRYASGLEAPSWLVSDGTLRLLALTLLSYAPEIGGIYLVEEPENGIHPRAVEVMFQSLSSVYGAQILCATHSPVVLSMAKPEQVLCFARDESGATDIVRGTDHPRLKDWKGEVDLGTLFAGGVMG
jgi:energy-coupling factor transporter ATP-binding protein EcfA2